MDVRTLPTIEQGIKFRDSQGGSTLVSYCPGNGSHYLVLVTEISHFNSDLKDRMGLGADGEGWLVTYLRGLPMVSMVITNNEGLIHWEYVWEKLQVSISDAVVLTELIGHVTGRPCISSEEFLADAQKGQNPRQVPCCERDLNMDGNCDRHPGSEAPI